MALAGDQGGVKNIGSSDSALCADRGGLEGICCLITAYIYIYKEISLKHLATDIVTLVTQDLLHDKWSGLMGGCVFYLHAARRVNYVQLLNLLQ